MVGCSSRWNVDLPGCLMAENDLALGQAGLWSGCEVQQTVVNKHVYTVEKEYQHI